MSDRICIVRSFVQILCNFITLIAVFQKIRFVNMFYSDIEKLN